MIMEYICIGRIVNTFGIRGEMKIQSYSDFDEKRYAKGNTVYILYQDQYLPFVTASFRRHKGFSLVSFADHQDINLVEQYKECEVYIDKDSRQVLKKGEYYRSDLEGLEVFDEEGNRIGKVSAVEDTLGANTFLRVEREEGNDVLIPYVKAFVKEVQMEEGKIIIHMVEGLL